MVASVLSTIVKILEVIPRLWQWSQRNKAKVRIAYAVFRPESTAGSAIEIEVLNGADRLQRIWVFAFLQSGEQLQPRTGQGMPTLPYEIGAEDHKVGLIPLVWKRPLYPPPVVATIEVRDAMKRKITLRKDVIERLNDQILNNWPFTEEDEEARKLR